MARACVYKRVIETGKVAFPMLLADAAEFETPIHALSSLNLETYDKVIVEFRKKHAEREAAKQRLIEAMTSVASAAESVVARLPELGARYVAIDARKLETFERALTDGIVPPKIDAFLSKLRADSDDLAQALKAINKATAATGAKFDKMDQRFSQVSIMVRRIFGELSGITKRLLSQYRNMVVQAESIRCRANLPMSGRVQRAVEHYKAAFGGAEGIHGIGSVFPDMRHLPPIYELPVAVDPETYSNRRKLRELERRADEYVERQDPTAVGAISFRFELALGAAWRSYIVC